MKLKRTMSMVMAGIMAAGMLAGCGSNGSSGGGSAASDSSAQKEMTFVIANRDEFMSKVEQAMTAEGEKLGYKIVTQDAQLDTAKQMQYVETCANAGQEAVAVLLVDTEAAQSIMDSAGDMKVAFVNRQPADLHVLDAENACYVGSDEFTSGYFQGEYLAKYFKDKGKTDIKYLMLQGTLGQVATTQRSEGALQALKDNGINATEGSAPLAADFDRPTAQEMIQPLLTTTEYDCIIANNDAMALGAVEACREAGVDTKALARRLGHLIPDGAEEDALARGERQAEAAADLRQDCREDDDEVKAAEPVEDAVPEDEAPHHVAARVVEARDARRRDGRHALEEGIDGIY